MSAARGCGPDRAGGPARVLVVMPLLAPFAKHYGFREWQIGLLFSAYPMCQLVAGPILGRLSDRYGRRPLLIFSQAGTAVSFLILGLSRDFWVMLLARMLDGASGGNILVAQAYVADVTKPEDRARGMGLIGMAFGLGFVLGPLLGGLLLSLPIAEEWRLRLPFLVAAGFSTVAWVLVLTRLPESLPRDGAVRQAARVVSWRGIVDTIRLPGSRPARPGRLPRRAGASRRSRGPSRCSWAAASAGTRARRRSPSPGSGS